MPGSSAVSSGGGASGSNVMGVTPAVASGAPGAPPGLCGWRARRPRFKITAMTTTSTPAVGVSEQVSAARSAQQGWARLPVRQRLRPVRAFRHLLADQPDALAAAVLGDLGKPAEETIGGEVLPLADACRFLERA